MLDAYLVPAADVDDLKRLGALRNVRIIGVPATAEGLPDATALADAVCQAAEENRR